MAFRPDAVLHIEWRGVRGPAAADSSVQDRNVRRAIALAEVAAAAGCSVWLGMGSLFELDNSVAPQYADAKRRALEATRSACGRAGLRHVWLRLSAAYGPADHLSRLVPSVGLALIRRSRPALTLGEQCWDLLFVRDAAHAVLAAAEHAEGVFELGSGEPVSVRRIAEILRDAVDPRLPLGFGELPYGPGEPRVWQANIGPLTSATGWRPTTPLRAGLRETLQWLRTVAM